MNSLQKSQLIVKLRPGVYQMPAGELVGFGPVEAKRGNGYAFCYNCNQPECEHTEALNQAWLDGVSVDEETIVFNGYHTPATVTAPPIGSTVVTQADIDAVERGNRPGAWKAVSREGLPSGWPMAQVRR